MPADQYVFRGETPFDCGDLVDGVLDEIDEQGAGEDDEDDDGWQEFKDGVAMGWWDREGRPLDPPEPDFDDRPDELVDYEPKEPPEDPWGVAPAEHVNEA